MKAFFALFRLNFKSLLLITMNSSTRKRKRSFSGAGVLVLLVALMLYVSAILSFTQFSQLSALGGRDVAFMAVMAMGLILPFSVTMFTAQGLIFSTKDADLVLSLPVSPLAIMLARLTALYAEVLLMCQVFLLPLIGAWFYYGGGGGVRFALTVLACGFFLALLPTLGGLLLGFVVGFAVSRFKYKNALTVVLSLGAVAALLFFSQYINMAGLMADGDVLGSLRATYSSIMPPVLWAYKAATGSFLHLLFLAAACLGPFLLVTWVFSLGYRNILTRFLSRHSGGKYRHKALSATGSFRALLKKEARKFFGTPIYLLNHGISIIMCIGLCVAALINRQTIMEIMGLLPGTPPQLLQAVVLAALLWLASIVMPASASLSLEGKTLWILKEAPLGAKKIFGAKTALNFILQGATVAICLALLIPTFAIPLPLGLLMLLCGLLLCGNLSALAMCANLWFPKMDAENETAVIKQSASVLVCMLASTIYLLLLGLGFYLCYRAGLGLGPYLAGVSLLALGANFGLWQYIKAKGSRLLLEL